MAARKARETRATWKEVENMTLGERIKHVRLISGKLTMEQFGKRLGLTPAAISQFESGKANPSEQTLRSICREFDISEDWLKRGIGDVAPKTYESELEKLVTERGLSHQDYVVIRNFMQLPPKSRETVWQFMLGVAYDITNYGTVIPGEPEEIQPPEPRNIHDWTDAEIRAEVDRQLDEEKKGTEESSTGSPKESDADCA